MLGMIKDITIDGNISLIELVITDENDNEKTIFVKAETRLFMNAIDECFGDDWKEQFIEFEIDSIDCMTFFIPANTDFE